MADLSLDRHILAGDRAKKAVKPWQRDASPEWTQVVFARASGLVKITRVTLRYRSRRDPQRGCERVGANPQQAERFGYRRLTVLLRREGWIVNPTQVYRLYTEGGLTVRTKTRKKIARRAQVRAHERPDPTNGGSIDFTVRHNCGGGLG